MNETVAERIQSCIVIGLILAAMLGLVSVPFLWNRVQVHPILLITMPVSYLLAAVVGGTLVALARPLWRFALGRLLIGAIVGPLSAVVTIMPLFGSPTGWGQAEWFGALTAGLLIGAIVGVAGPEGKQR